MGKVLGFLISMVKGIFFVTTATKNVQPGLNLCEESPETMCLNCKSLGCLKECIKNAETNIHRF